MFELTDDGTLDTVLKCSVCGHTERYDYDPQLLAAVELYRLQELGHEFPELTVSQLRDSLNDRLYDEHVAACIAEATDEHVCVRYYANGERVDMLTDGKDWT